MAEAAGIAPTVDRSIAMPRAKDIPWQVKSVERRARGVIADYSLIPRLGITDEPSVTLFQLSLEERLLREDLTQLSKTASEPINQWIRRTRFIRRLDQTEVLTRDAQTARDFVVDAKALLVETAFTTNPQEVAIVDYAVNDLAARFKQIYGCGPDDERFKIVDPDETVLTDWADAWKDRILQTATV